MSIKLKGNTTVLITGGAGFIGSNVLEFLFNKYPNYEFVVLDALTYAGDIKNIPEYIRNSKNFKFWYGDIKNAKLVEHLVAKSDFIIHFAAETHVARSIYDDANFFETDVIGTQRIANAVLNNQKKIKRFIHISTSEVYGTALDKKMAENHPLNPMSPYAAAKTGADRLVYSYISTYKIPAVIIRPFNMYGPKQHLEKLIPRFITSFILKEPFTIHGAGESKRDFTYVMDLARAIDLIIHAPAKKVDGQIFNVGSGKDYSVNEIANLIIKTMNGASNNKEKIEFTSYALNVGDRPGQVFRHTAGIEKISKILGWRPTVEFNEGLKKTIEWYLENRDWWEDKIWMRHVPIETEKGKIEFH
ncbi:GDP-mannose 4,6-dehydratase [Candidatus Wolfebacteria bacterium]|nr:GDP-mannose 4,6-dehydratase [Candidatus Wolfebacteria bacterium]